MRILMLFVVFTSVLYPTLSAQSFKGHYINLNRQRAHFTSNLIYISEVVNVSGGGEAIGVGFKGIENLPVSLAVKRGAAAALSATLNQPEDGDYLDTAIIRITGLRVNEFITLTNERRFVEMEAELAFPTENGYDIYGPQRIREVSAGLDVTSGHPNAIMDAFERITTLLMIDRFKSGPVRQISAEELRQPINRHPIFDQDISKIPDGVYASYMDFRAAQVDTSTVVELAEKNVYHQEDSVAYHVATADRPDDLKAKDFRQLWGIQSEGLTYMRVGRDFYEIKRLPDGTIAVAVPDNIFDVGPHTGAIVGGVSFGMTGAFIGVLIDQGVRNRKEEPRLYHLNLATGYYVDADASQIRLAAEGIVIESSPLNQPEQLITITTPDERSVTLKPKAYAIIPRNSEVCFSAPGAKPTCTVLETRPASPQTLYRLTVNKRGKIRFTWMPDEIAATTYRRIAEDRVVAAKPE